MNTFIASEIRIEWAREKLDQFETFVQRAIDNALKCLISNSQADRMKVMLDFNASVTPEARRLISEYALHARAALDYIVFDLAFHNHGVEKKHTQFPIHSCPQEFPWKEDKSTGTWKGIGCVKYLHPEQVALIERFQPYHGFPSLHVLHELSNRDKHRHFARIATTGYHAQVATPNTDPATSAAKMEVQLQHSYQVILEDGDDAITTLRMLHTQLTQIFSAFNKLLDP